MAHYTKFAVSLIENKSIPCIMDAALQDPEASHSRVWQDWPTEQGLKALHVPTLGSSNAAMAPFCLHFTTYTARRMLESSSRLFSS